MNMTIAIANTIPILIIDISAHLDISKPREVSFAWTHGVRFNRWYEDRVTQEISTTQTQIQAIIWMNVTRKSGMTTDRDLDEVWNRNSQETQTKRKEFSGAIERKPSQMSNDAAGDDT